MRAVVTYLARKREGVLDACSKDYIYTSFFCCSGLVLLDEIMMHGQFHLFLESIRLSVCRSDICEYT